jgi:hypothetical protein
MGIKRRMQIFNRQRKEAKFKDQQASAKKHTRISEHDKRVVMLLKERGCMDLGSLKKNLWNNQTDDTVKMSLLRLVKAGIIKSAEVERKEESFTIYYVGKKPAYTEVIHMIEASRILDFIVDKTGNKLISMRNEHSLKSDMSLMRGRTEDMQVPDFEASFENEGGVITLTFEIDSVNYTGKRLSAKARGLSLGAGQKTVLWVCKSSKRLDTVSKAVNDYTNIKPILFSDLRNL